MEKFSYLILIIALLISGAAIAGCTSTTPASTTAQPTAISATITPVTTNTAANQSGPISIFYVQTAEKGTFTPGTDGTYTLTLIKAVPHTFYFSDRPDRIAGSQSNDKFISTFNWSPAPNAAITLPQAKYTEDTLILELANPRYNASSGDLIYTATIVKDYKKSTLSDFVHNVDAGIPQTFDRVTLFIDSGELRLVR